MRQLLLPPPQRDQVGWDWLSDHNTHLWLAREVFLNNDSFPSMNVRLSLEELGHSEGGLYRIAAYRTEEYSANIRSLDQNSKVRQLMSSSLPLQMRCPAQPGAGLPVLRAGGGVLAPGVPG